MGKISFKARLELLSLKVRLFFIRLKIMILAFFLKRENTMETINTYENDKNYFIVNLCTFIFGLKYENEIETVYLTYKALLESNYLLYGVDNREFRAFLKSLEIPVPNEKKEEILVNLINKLHDLDPEISEILFE